MYFPQFLVGMFTAATIAGAWVYLASGSLWKALTWAVVSLIVLQLGYFVLVVRLVRRLKRGDQVGTAPGNLPNYGSGKRAH